MPALGIRTVASSLNGASATYIPPILSLSLHYCDWAGSSRGMNSFLRSAHLPQLTSSHPHVEFKISPRPGKHPVLKAQYVNGREKAVCVRNLRVEEIRQKVEGLLGNDGKKNRRLGARKVVAANESVRGVWSPMHGGIKRI